MSLNPVVRGYIGAFFHNYATLRLGDETVPYAAELRTDLHLRLRSVSGCRRNAGSFQLVRPTKSVQNQADALRVRHHAFDNARGRYTIRFYIVAILFVVFDVETIFLFPWAVQFKLLGFLGCWR